MPSPGSGFDDECYRPLIEQTCEQMTNTARQNGLRDPLYRKTDTHKRSATTTPDSGPITGHPEAGRLIRQALLASASIPGAFPPVYIPVEAPDGKTYDEMHVDGGVSSQMFFYPAGSLQNDRHVDLKQLTLLSLGQDSEDLVSPPFFYPIRLQRERDSTR